MKLTLHNIGPLREADIRLDGVTVLAGYNGTGKSTVSKALYGILTGVCRLDERIVAAKEQSIQRALTDYLFASDKEGRPYVPMVFLHYDEMKERLSLSRYEEFEQEFPGLCTNLDPEMARRNFPELRENIQKIMDRPDEDYFDFIAGSIFREIFEKQINTIDSVEPGTIWLSRKSGDLSARFQKGKIAECSQTMAWATVPVYLKSAHILDKEFEGEPFFREQAASLPTLREQLLPDRPERKRTLEEEEEIEKILQHIDDIVGGKLVSDGYRLLFDTGLSVPISILNMASGTKTFAVLRRLVENGTIARNGVLILDEPEENLHPAWQLKMAELLVMLHKRLNLCVFLNTHSLYFLRAVEVYSQDYEVEDRCHYYKTEPADDSGRLFRTACVDGRTELIFHDMYLPLKEL